VKSEARNQKSEKSSNQEKRKLENSILSNFKFFSSFELFSDFDFLISTFIL